MWLDHKDVWVECCGLLENLGTWNKLNGNQVYLLTGFASDQAQEGWAFAGSQTTRGPRAAGWVYLLKNRSRSLNH